ncbi:glycoside hydrolase family 52 protein [Paenibacillus silvisoli]|uniref:glycoside hydrolase family 52 protein n=1 Tax=Paenibacillus silvisoli TaxID=3110539 RepID=UPI002803CA68|nr:glycoside hydrolase family 52 protein [Paenibacillus silvisoli]
MQMMADALTVLGSRIGIGWDPGRRRATLIRHGHHPGLPLQLSVGVNYEDGRTVVLPLCADGESFPFIDQEMTACSMSLSGIDPSTGIHVKLIVRIPFRPRDAVFSTTPVVLLDVELKRLEADFRWQGQAQGDVKGTLFLGITAVPAEGFAPEPNGNRIDIQYASPVARPKESSGPRELACRDRLVLEGAAWNSNTGRAESPFTLGKGERGTRLSVAWCVYDAPVTHVLGSLCPFKYTERFGSLEEVADWAEHHADEIRLNAERVDGILSRHTLGTAVTHLMAQTLHSWLLNTWWTVRPDGQDWFTVWEGICQLNSTLDVEYTQAPFYLAVWPELLEIQLRQWPFFAKYGTITLGDRGTGTLFMSHDVGRLTDCDHADYPHEMEVEETANYVLLAYTHWRRTGKDAVIREQEALIRKLLGFIVMADSTGNGIPDRGCANTLDDASPAVQYASEQVYLGVKAMAACKAGIEILKHIEAAGAGRRESSMIFSQTAALEAFVEQACRTLEERGWLEDHYVVTLTRTMDGLTDPWTGEKKSGELAGWNAYHIYTQNGLALLDMTGFEAGLSPDRLAQDLRSAMQHTAGRYGCRHTSAVNSADSESKTVAGLMSSSKRVGWISMNMLRDIAAAYRGIDFLHEAQRYWDWQQTVNSQGMYLFHETFYGNHLHFYPRGIAIFGYFDAAAGFVYDAVSGTRTFSPVRSSLAVPILLEANWSEGTCLIYEAARKEEGVR